MYRGMRRASIISLDEFVNYCNISDHAWYVVRHYTWDNTTCSWVAGSVYRASDYYAESAVAVTY